MLKLMGKKIFAILRSKFSVINLWWSSTKFVQIMAVGAEMASPVGSYDFHLQIYLGNA